MTRTYRAEFFTATHWAVRDIEAETPEQALEIAKRFSTDHRQELEFKDYRAVRELGHVQIWDPERGTLTSWMSREFRLRVASADMLKALREQTEAAHGVIANWDKGDLAGAVRALAETIPAAEDAIALAETGRLP